MLEKRCVDVRCIQEVRWQGTLARSLTGKAHRYEIFGVGNGNGVGCVGILLVENWGDKVIEVVRVCDIIFKYRLILQGCIATVILAYAS